MNAMNHSTQARILSGLPCLLLSDALLANDRRALRIRAAAAAASRVPALLRRSPETGSAAATSQANN